MEGATSGAKGEPGTLPDLADGLAVHGQHNTAIQYPEKGVTPGLEDTWLADGL